MEINYREFLRNFRKYRTGYEKIEVMGKRGLVGVWTPAVLADPETGEVVVEEYISPTEAVVSFSGKEASVMGNEAFVNNAAGKKFAELLNKSAKVEYTPISPEVPQYSCFKCGAMAVGTHTWYDDIEIEDRTEWFCSKCAKERGVKLKIPKI